MTGAPDRRSLHLDPPSVLSDESLGERLAALARSSVPTVSPRARRRWGLPVAGAVLAVATAGATFGADQVRHHGDGPQPVVPATHLERSTDRPSLIPTPADEQVQPIEPPTTFRPAGEDDGSPGDSHRRDGTSATSHPGDDAGDDRGDDRGGDRSDDGGDDSGHDGGGNDSDGSEPSDGDSATQDASEDAPEGSDDRGDAGDVATQDAGSEAGGGGTGEHDG